MVFTQFRDWSPEVLSFIQTNQPCRFSDLLEEMQTAIRKHPESKPVNPYKRIDAALQKLAKQGQVRFDRKARAWRTTTECLKA